MRTRLRNRGEHSTPLVQRWVHRRLVVAVTVDESIPLLGGIPHRLAEQGWDVHVVSSGGVHFDRIALLEGVTTHRIAMRRDPAPLPDLMSLIRWVRLLISLRPTTLWVSTPKAALLGILAGALTGVPHRSYLVRGLRMETASGLKRRLLWLFELVAMRLSTDRVAISDSLAERVEELSLARPSSVAVPGRGSSHGVDLARFDPALHSTSEARQRLNLQDGDFVVGFVGRLCVDKGVLELCSAVEELQAAGGAHLVLVGSVEEPGLLAQLRDRLSSSMTHVGFAEAVEEFYPAFDVLCLPSHREGFGNVVIEAGAMGVPAVVSNATGVRDSIDDGLTGLTVPVHDPHALAQALAVFRERETRDRMGLAARTLAQVEFDSRAVEDRYVAHIESLS